MEFHKRFSQPHSAYFLQPLYHYNASTSLLYVYYKVMPLITGEVKIQLKKENGIFLPVTGSESCFASACINLSQSKSLL